MMRVSKVLGLLAGLSAGSVVHASDRLADQAYFELKAPKITVEEIDPASIESEALRSAFAEATNAPNESSPPSVVAELDAAEVILDRILSMGRKVWAVIEANKPVLSFTTQNASAVPTGVQSWLQLSGWQTPRAYVYRVTYENLYGIDVVDFSYRVMFTPGGSVNGRGRYLSNVTIVPNTIDVAWGFTFNASASVVNTINTGSATAPVAGMELLLTWSAESPLKKSENTASYFVRGDGEYVNLTGGRY
jgi:hypothetical protein